jgi:hypothetical protein
MFTDDALCIQSCQDIFYGKKKAITTLFIDLTLCKPEVRFSQTERWRGGMCERSTVYCFNLQAILDHHFEENLDMSPSSRTVTSDTVPVLIPGSPLKRSPSRQSSHESVEAVDPILDDEGPETEGNVPPLVFKLRSEF